MGHNRVSEITNLLDDVADTLVLLGGDPAKADILKSYKNRNDVPIAIRDFFESIKFDVFIVRAWSSVKGFKELKSKCDLLLSMISNYQQSRYI